MEATTPNNENQPFPGPAPSGSENFSHFPANTKPKVPAHDKTILEQINLLRCASWSSEDHKEAADLLSEFADMFSQHDMDLGETSAVKHEIKLEPNSWPFHERYWPIPQSMFEEVCKHLQEMLEIGVIRPSSSPWASVGALVHKRDGASFSSALTWANCTTWPWRMCIAYLRYRRH